MNKAIENNNSNKTNNDNLTKNITNIKYYGTVINSYASQTFDNSFIAFNSKNDGLYLIYATDLNSKIIYDLINNQNINEIKEAHKSNITNFKYLLDKYNKKDLFLSISSDDNNLKLWNICNFQCIVNLKKINKIGKLLSSCFLDYKKQVYMITCNYNPDGACEPIKIFDLKGNKIKEINNSNNKTFYIDIYYETNKNNESQIYIITGNNSFVNSYNYNKNELYYKYIEEIDNNDDLNNFESIVVNNERNIVKLICSSHIGKVLIWDFHKNILLNKILIDNNYKCFNGLCLWDNNYILIGSDDETIKIIDIKEGKIIKSLEGYYSSVSCLKIIYHSKYGKCLLSQPNFEEPIKLWII